MRPCDVTTGSVFYASCLRVGVAFYLEISVNICLLKTRLLVRVSHSHKFLVNGVIIHCTPSLDRNPHVLVKMLDGNKLAFI